MARRGADQEPWLRDDDGEAPEAPRGTRDDHGAGASFREAERIELDRADGERQAGTGGLRGEHKGGGAAQDVGTGGADGGARDGGICQDSELSPAKQNGRGRKRRITLEIEPFLAVVLAHIVRDEQPVF